MTHFTFFSDLIKKKGNFMNEQMENVLRERCTNEYDYKLRYPKFAKLLNPISRSSATGLI